MGAHRLQSGNNIAAGNELVALAMLDTLGTTGAFLGVDGNFAGRCGKNGVKWACLHTMMLGSAVAGFYRHITGCFFRMQQAVQLVLLLFGKGNAYAVVF